MKNLLILTVLLSLSACGPIEKQVRNGLMSAGVAKDVASCMAPKMDDKLSLMQLRKLAALGNLEGKSVADIRAMPFDRLMRNVRALKDAEIVTVVSTAWVSCAL